MGPQDLRVVQQQRSGAEGAPLARALSPLEVPHNLPLAVSTFVGRTEEIAELKGLFPNRRLVTLTGPPGIGKTRLALQAAAHLIGSNPEGVWLVELGTVSSPGDVVRAVAYALSIGEEPGRPLGETLVSHLRPRRLVLVLDNCEHLVSACAELVDSLLPICPDLSVLATSQEALGIAGEIAWAVPPLSMSEGDGESGDVSKFEAVRLFVERAAAARRGFSLTPEVTTDVVEVCRRLDGIPLAIELAASRASALSPSEILARLDEPLRFLAVGNRTALERHRTLRAALEWTHSLLSDTERALFRRLSVFAGGFTMEAARKVCAGEGAEEEEVFEALEGLARKSLVAVEVHHTATRYSLLETIRQFARDRLREAGEADRFLLRHALWCVEHVKEPGSRGAVMRSVSADLEALEAEHDNLRTALGWMIDHGYAEPALELTIGLVGFWHAKGYFSEGREWHDRALSVATEAPATLRAAALRGAGGLAVVMGDFAAAVPALEESLKLLTEARSTPWRAAVTSLLGFARVFTSGPPEALPLLEEGVELAREARSASFLASSLSFLARAHLFQGQPGQARPILEEYLEVARAAGNTQGAADALVGLGWAAMIEGDYLTAESVVAEALAQAEGAGDSYVTALSLSFLGELKGLRGGGDEATKLLQRSSELARAMRAPFPLARAFMSLGRVAQADGEMGKARAYLEEAELLARQSGQKFVAPWAVLGVAELAQAEGDYEQARKVASDALSLARANHDRWTASHALVCLGAAERARGQATQAASRYHEALRIQGEIPDTAGAVDSLEGLVGLAAAEGRALVAARLAGAAGSLRQRIGYPRPALHQRRFDADMAAIEESLSPEERQRALQEGATLSLHHAISHASKGRGPRGRPSLGWESLTRIERDVVALVAEGLSNREIGERLFLSPRTVGAHLARIFPRLDVSSRKELATLVREQQDYEALSEN